MTLERYFALVSAAHFQSKKGGILCPGEVSLTCLAFPPRHLNCRFLLPSSDFPSGVDSDPQNSRLVLSEAHWAVNWQLASYWGAGSKLSESTALTKGSINKGSFQVIHSQSWKAGDSSWRRGPAGLPLTPHHHEFHAATLFEPRPRVAYSTEERDQKSPGSVAKTHSKFSPEMSSPRFLDFRKFFLLISTSLHVYVGMKQYVFKGHTTTFIHWVSSMRLSLLCCFPFYVLLEGHTWCSTEPHTPLDHTLVSPIPGSVLFAFSCNVNLAPSQLWTPKRKLSS